MHKYTGYLRYSPNWNTIATGTDVITAGTDKAMTLVELDFRPVET